MDVPCEPSSHLNCLGLSDCKYIPSVIEFNEQDPLGQLSVKTNYLDLFSRDCDKLAQFMVVTKSLGEQASSLKDRKARMYALERVSKAIRINVSKKIAFSVLDAVVRTLNFDEIKVALNDLGVDNVLPLIDFMKMYEQLANFDLKDDGNLDCHAARGDSNRWKVLSVAIKVFMCQNEQALDDVARYCIRELLQQAKGQFWHSRMPYCYSSIP